MFTGLIEDVGVIEEARDSAAGRELRVRSTFSGLTEGESIAMNGACLTVLAHGEGWFTVAAVFTTLGRTDIASWTAGTRVNLERAMRADARLGGHIVQGHVDGVGTVESAAAGRAALLADDSSCGRRRCASRERAHPA